MRYFLRSTILPFLLIPTYGYSQMIDIQLIFNDKIATATLEDNPTTQSMIQQLPITLQFNDYAKTEKTTSFPNKLSRKNAPEGYKPSIGDITSYGPWGNLAIFYQPFSYSRGLIYMGKFTSGFEDFTNQKQSFEVTIQLLEE